MIDLNSTDTLPSEGYVLDLTDMAEEPSQGAWLAGWYCASVIEGYSTRKGTQFLTADTISKDGNSRNLRLCIAVQNATGQTRNLQTSLNYRLSDLTVETNREVKEARAEFKGIQKWPGAEGANLQRSSLAIAKIGALQKATGVKELSLTDVGILAGIFIGVNVIVRLAVDEKGYNEIKEFSKIGTPHAGGLK
jgi:hypothetical protein